MRYCRLPVGLLEQLPASVSRSQPCGEKLLLHLLLTPARRRIPGLSRTGPAALAEELGWDTVATVRYLEELVQADLVLFDRGARIIFVTRAVLDDPPKNIQTLIAFAADLRELPASPITDAVRAAVATAITGEKHENLRAEWYRLTDSRANSQGDSCADSHGSSSGDKQPSPLPLPDPSPSPNPTPKAADAASHPLAALWNSVMPMPPFARVRAMTPRRRKHADARLAEHTIDVWQRVLEIISQSSFHRGGGTRAWVADFDWLIKTPDQAVRALEGQFVTGNVQQATVPRPLKTPTAAKPDAVQQQLETRRRRQEMTDAGMSPEAIEEIFEREYEERRAQAVAS